MDTKQLDLILQTHNFNSFSKDELIEVIAYLKLELKKYRTIELNQYQQQQTYYNTVQTQLNKKTFECQNLQDQLDKISVQRNNLYNKLSQPLTMKERITGKIDLKRLNQAK